LSHIAFNLIDIMPVYFNGLVLGLSLIMALGPQNVFLIRQGAMRQHAILSALTCFFSDFILITASVAGLHHILESHPSIRIWLTGLGSLFLLFYGGKALKLAFVPKKPNELNDEKVSTSRFQIIMLALGFSLLNPHAIIDSLVLIGGFSGQFPDHQQAFLFGVLTSSFVWFLLLTFVARYFSALLTRPHIWRRVEFLSGSLMIYLSVKLMCDQLQ
jgi:L-lysine exporter family protein LysE/ArgO